MGATELERPVQRLCPLELSCDAESKGSERKCTGVQTKIKGLSSQSKESDYRDRNRTGLTDKENFILFI